MIFHKDLHTRTRYITNITNSLSQGRRGACTMRRRRLCNDSNQYVSTKCGAVDSFHGVDTSCSACPAHSTLKAQSGHRIQPTRTPTTRPLTLNWTNTTPVPHRAPMVLWYKDPPQKTCLLW